MIGRLGQASRVEASALSVPAIVQSFTCRATGGSPIPNAVWLRQCGEMRADLGHAWRPFTANQIISIHEPGFVWLARMRAAPFTYAHVLDSYVGGEGHLEARLFGSLPLARLAGPQAAKGELMRYLAELVWAPHAILHNPQLSWCEVDATTIEVSVGSAAGPARVRLIFKNGDVAGIEADDRPRAVGRRIVPTRWQGRCDDYREMNGWRVPTRAMASWLLDDGPFEYWRGTVTAIGSK